MIGHANVINYSERPYDDINQMNDSIINMVVKTVKAGDEIYFLGDLGKSKEVIKRFFNLLPRNVAFHWIKGNHDKKLYNCVSDRLASLSEIKEVSLNKHKVILCHYPMVTWNQSHRNSWMLYGHHHKNGHGIKGLAERTTGKMLNVNLEFNNCKMYSEIDIIHIMKAMGDNWDYIPKDLTKKE